MDFEPSPEHVAFRKVVREFAEAEIAPHAAEWDRDHHFPVEVVRKMGDLGLFGLPFPEEYGGSGSGLLRSEERRVGKECRSRWSPYH